MMPLMRTIRARGVKRGILKPFKKAGPAPVNLRNLQTPYKTRAGVRVMGCDANA